jgi:glycosyltransferase XagB
MGVEFVAVTDGLHRAVTIDRLQRPASEIQIQDWPDIQESWLVQAMGRMTEYEHDLMLRHKIMAYSWQPFHVVHCVVDEEAFREGQRRGLNMMGRVSPELYRKLVQRHLAKRLERKAVHELKLTKPWASAQRRLNRPQVVVALMIFLIATEIAVLHSSAVLLAIVQILACLFFLMVVCLRCLCLLPLPRGKGRAVQPLLDDALPVYTVLVPLFREISVLQRLVQSLTSLDYPRGKLDIKIILEEADRPMQMAVRALDLPSYFDIVIVPRGKPQTKPRALNYAMQFSRGTLATIYDGEDIPQSNQLRLAAARFAHADDDMACLQASLDFFNPSENFLSQHFTAEYAALFRVVLPTLAAYGLPLPLGGTSNHFRVSALQAVGFWDAFNVAEDADLGIRLARHGYKTGILESTTFEEANTQLGNWMKQRRRWLKGYLQTWLVHNRNPLLVMRELGMTGYAALQVITLGIFASALLHPVLLVSALWNFLPHRLAEMTSSFAGSMMSGASLVILVAGYASAMAASKAGLAKVGVLGWSRVLATIPFYWLLVSAAAWMALWDFIVAPFHWHKTRHGLSREHRKTGHIQR